MDPATTVLLVMGSLVVIVALSVIFGSFFTVQTAQVASSSGWGNSRESPVRV